MNKFMGFYELKSLNIPTVPWKLFSADTVLEPQLLWTVRVATEAGNDLHLPRAVGVEAEEACLKARMFAEEFRNKGIVIYYPYFIAEKSGVLDMNSERTVIEAVDKDLWNLVTYGRKDVTVIIPAGYMQSMDTDMMMHAGTGPYDSCGAQNGQALCFTGNEAFMAPEELRELLGYGSVIRGRFRDDINGGGSILAEWSYAYSTDISHQPVGDRYLVFYELRGISGR
ncbi:MAG: hypothetical protein GX279_11425 [Clostridiaceae bacterium]|jgi:hypothetical protein|nr:hypothetical protein [Clostridiaceae bacterium]